MTVKFAVALALAFSLVACTEQGPAPSATPSNQTPEPTGVASTPPATADQRPAQPEAATPPTAAEKSTAAESSTASPILTPQPQFREVTIPAGTALNVRLTTPLASDKSAVEDPVRGTLTGPITVAGFTVVPAGSEIVGTVRSARRSGRVKGRASIAFRFERLIVRDEPHAIRTAQVTREAAHDRSDDVKKGVIGGAAGAIVGGIVGGGRGAAIGAGAGATGAVLATRGDEVELPAGTTVRTTLQDPLDVVVPLTKSGAQR